MGLATDPAGAGRKKPKKGEEVTQVVAPKPVKSKPVAVFDAPLPNDTGPIPEGLANLTAQGCAACHFDSHTGWQHSAHATAWRSERFNEAVDVAGTPACTVCHLPLVTQRPELLTFDGADVDKPVTGPNPAFNASLRLEGVTCAACHVRNGVVIGSRPPEEVGKAPHPLAWSEDLASSKGCAACHQLSWPGANAAFYDTFGEWSDSPHAKAGVGCVDCHGGPGASGRIAGTDHAMPRGENRAVSILLELPSLDIVRGGDAVPLGITLQNTGAGHAFPTGSPFKGVQLAAWLEGPPEKEDGPPTKTEPFVSHLAREISDAPPWNTLGDSRIPAGGQVRFDTTLALEHGLPEGRWTLRVQLVETVRGEPTGRVLVTRDLPVLVE